MDAERERLAEADAGREPWKRWGPYLAERQWGTVREDYSRDGNAWDYFPHDAARSRAYRWGEDGIAGLCDDRQLLCLSLALWNERDPILKERLFGLTGPEGNHGEDVKELYYYLDNTPTHSYMKMLYKYCQAAFPYAALVEENGRRGKDRPEFELLETGVFDENRYFDVFVEYAKAAPEDILLRVTAFNRGPEAAPLHLIPLVFFRNTWSWDDAGNRPRMERDGNGVFLRHHDLGDCRLYFEGDPDLLFCDNDTDPRIFGLDPGRGWFKNGVHEAVVHGRTEAVNPGEWGTRVGIRYRSTIEPGGSTSVRLRLSREPIPAPFADAEAVFRRRREEADAFYAVLQEPIEDPDARHVQRLAFAGLLWCKQFYAYEVARWLEGDPGQPPPPPERKHGRNHEWTHLHSDDVISMPDTWEYPWFAAWDLAFHCIPLARIDPDFAKEQLILFTREWTMHPSGQMPAYEWAFGHANPPVHAWAAWRVYKIDAAMRGGEGDVDFLERVFHKLLLNFTWWVNRKDTNGDNLFQGGFLGLDNIGVFDRSAPLPTGGHIEQADGTSWMAMYCLNMLRISLELAARNPVYQDLATKFFEHFLYIAAAMCNVSQDGIDLWDETDEFFYDVLHLGDGKAVSLKVRSIVGLTPLFAVETLEPDLLERVPEFKKRMEWFLRERPDLSALISRWYEPGMGDRRLLSLLRGHRMKRLLRRMLDESEFLSDHGVRALSRHHRDHPYTLEAHGMSHTVDYEPAESTGGLFGGNSNWRGPVWFPVNFLIIESLQKFHHYYGDDFKVECPTGSGVFVTINEIAEELGRRLSGIFLRGPDGRRPVFGGDPRLQTDPDFRNHVLFYEYFHGDTGRGVGASHQTGWTGLVAKLLQPRRPPKPETSTPTAGESESP